jgi:low temperature requirement protein LtrA
MASASLLRDRGKHGQVGTIELFFDLVFVFAVTQLSHALLAHLDPLGALRVGLLMLAVWWAWIDTSWVTNWLDPERLPVRGCLLALMLAGLVLSASLPEAFGEQALVFACAYATLQVGRSLFFLWAVRGEAVGRRRNFQRILVWQVVAAALWIVGAQAAPGARLAWWAAALALESAGPLAFFHVPGLGRSSTADWDVDGHHLAERCGLFVIIALGESLLVTGATAAELPFNAANAGAFLVAFVGSVAMWWLYFDTGAERGARHFARADDPGRVARAAYTYLHLPIVAGIIVCAVGDEILLTHTEHADTAGLVAILAGPALYLLGNALFKWITNRRRTPPLSHMAGLVLLLALAPLAGHATVLQLSLATTAVLVLVAAWESVALRRPA